ncbi:ATP-binding protein [Agrobacterium cavarae]|uniref:ATP-binding protein n=1 Tax=Agrobacterium cavarae TaxID=2528239 RepID=UPI003EE77DCA
MPPYLAGRKQEEEEFRHLLDQTTILDNLVLTGLRGVGKTVLLETFKPLAIQKDWLWVGTDMSEAVSISEANFAIRILTDLSVVTSTFTVQIGSSQTVGFNAETKAVVQSVNYGYLHRLYEDTPGLVLDKLKVVLEFVWTLIKGTKAKGLIFAYDEAQNLADHVQKEQYPLSVMLDLFQSIQKKGIPFMLVLVGLPTLFPKLVEARTYAERMFRVVSLGQLSEPDRRDAIVKPIEDAKCPVKFTPPSVEVISNLSGGYPYFIQFICREAFDLWIQQQSHGGEATSIPADAIRRKLDTDFFAGRWARATDRQREMLYVIAKLENGDSEFSVQEIVDMSGTVLDKGFSSSHTNQMLVALSNAGLVYKNRYGRYSFAVPLMAGFILRQAEEMA